MSADDEPRRPDPEALLAEASKASRGRLKVFLGMSPGVGKTYAMLLAAKRRQAEGADVAVGLVETHGRKETEALLDGLEVLPRKPITYKGRTLMEFDIDAALARKPDLLIVDEYAHSNAPGSRHPKRWQDVAELIAAGINVWTTLNIQHLESLVEVVWKITGVRQRETVPDAIFARADEIEVVDLTPEELRQRLAEGKVYVPETARLAADNFFKPENLTALRELALRKAAQTVDDQLIGHLKRTGAEGPWAAGERILVLVTGDAMSAALVRAGRRLSDMMMDAPWTVAHVDRPNRARANAPSVLRLTETMKLAEQLGAATVMLTGDDIVDAVQGYARRNNITQIVIGRSKSSRWRRAFGRSLTQALLKDGGGPALHIVTEGAPEPRPAPARVRPASQLGQDALGFLAGAVFIAMATGVAWLFDKSFAQPPLDMIYVAAVVSTATLFGTRPGLASAGLGFLVYNFLFLEPRFSFAIGHATDLLDLVVFLAVGSATGSLAGRVRDQARETGRRASAVTALLAASRRLSSAVGKQAVAQALAEQTSATVSGKALVLLPDGEDLRPAAGSPVLEPLGAAEMSAARWAWEHGESAGAGTGTLPQIGWVFWPLQGVRARAGVAAVEAGKVASVDDERYVLALLDQGAVALERAEFAAEAADAEALRRSDRLRSALLNSISHDLRTPLSTVLGSTTTLIDYGDQLAPEVRADLLQSIREEAERLNRYVGDLLDMTRLEGGALEPRSDLFDVRKAVDAAVERVARRLGARRLERDYAVQVSLVKADAGLLEQAVVNILENAIAYSPEGSLIEVAVYEDQDDVVVSIEDQGRGIARTDLERIFEKFRRLDQPSDRGKGAGLGLSIAKGFVEAMGGRIAAVSPVTDRGTRLLISLPKPVRTHEFLL
jgi:two-component system sensor histidine kinase KdpD